MEGRAYCMTNAPAIFQTAMNQILKEDVLAEYCLVYLDDMIIKSETRHLMLMPY